MTGALFGLPQKVLGNLRPMVTKQLGIPRSAQGRPGSYPKIIRIHPKYPKVMLAQ
jgi:hypothetical protein